MDIETKEASVEDSHSDNEAPTYNSLKELDTKRQETWYKAKSWLADNPREEEGWSEEQTQTWQQMNNLLDDLDSQIDLGLKQRKVAWGQEDIGAELDAKRSFRQSSNADISDDLYHDAFMAWAQFGEAGLSRVSAEAQQAWSAAKQEWATAPISTATGTGQGQGGATIPTSLAERVEQVLNDISPVAQIATVDTSENGAPVSYPVLNDSAQEGRWITEAADTADPAGGPLFSAVTINTHMSSSDMIPVSIQFLQDTALSSFEARLATMLGTRLGLLQNKAYTSGTGSGQPQGYINKSGLDEHDIGFAAGGSITAAGVGNLLSIPEEIKVLHQSNAVFTISRPFLTALRRIVRGAADATPIWLPGSVAAGDPPTILGYPYLENVHLGTTAIANNSVLGSFGNHTGYVIRRVRELAMVRDESVFRRNLQVAFLAYQRVGADVVNDDGYIKLMADI